MQSLLLEILHVNLMGLVFQLIDCFHTIYL